MGDKERRKEIYFKFKMTLRYTNCCGCFTAKTGALILAILGIFSGGTGLISDSIGYGVYMPAVEERLDQFKEETLDHYEQAGEPEEQRDMVEQYLKVIDVTKDALPYVHWSDCIFSPYSTHCCNVGLWNQQWQEGVHATLVDQSLHLFGVDELGRGRIIHHVLRGDSWRCYEWTFLPFDLFSFDGFVFLLLVGGQVRLFGPQGECQG